MSSLFDIFKSKEERKILCDYCKTPIEKYEDLVVYMDNPIRTRFDGPFKTPWPRCVFTAVPFHAFCAQKKASESKNPSFSSLKLPVNLTPVQHGAIFWVVLFFCLVLPFFVEPLAILSLVLAIAWALILPFFKINGYSLFPIPVNTTFYLILIMVSLLFSSLALFFSSLGVLVFSGFWFMLFLFLFLIKYESYFNFEMPLKLGLKGTA